MSTNSVQTAPAAGPTPPTEYDQLVDQYFDFVFQFHPTDATAAGFHQYDAQLGDYSQAAREREAAGLESIASKLARIDPATLSPDSADDLAFLRNTIQGRLLELRTIQMWRKDPNVYVGGVTDAVFVIMKRSFAPPEERLRSVVAREHQIPAVLQAGRENLSNPPQIYTQISLEQMNGIIDFFRHDVPNAFRDVKDAALCAEFHSANSAVLKTLEDFQSFLHKDLLPASHGDFRIGAENYRKKLHDDEMVDIPLDELLKIGYADLRQNQEKLKQTAAQIDPYASPREVLAFLEKDHPAPADLLSAFGDLLGHLRDFLLQKRIIAVPSPVFPKLEETPPFMRATTTASMDTPGAYETKATEAMFNVTLPEPDWPKQRVEEWMEGFNQGTILSTAIHETYPGHYVQFLWAQHLQSKVRKLLTCNSNVEGWAHYTEQMMLDEGYGGGDPKLRMGQLQDALLRDARFVAGIEMHTGKMTMEQAREFFVREGYQVPPVADVEAKRGTSDPTYLVYTLGKLQIMKLREDYRKKLGDKFRLEDFHNRFVQQGGIPLVLIRRAMLGDSTPSL